MTYHIFYKNLNPKPNKRFYSIDVFDQNDKLVMSSSGTWSFSYKSKNDIKIKNQHIDDLDIALKKYFFEDTRITSSYQKFLNDPIEEKSRVGHEIPGDSFTDGKKNSLLQEIELERLKDELNEDESKSA